MSDFNVKITIRNNHILRRIRKTHDSVAQFCREFNLNNTVINSLICMRITPLQKSGELISAAEDLCSALCVSPSELWPKDMEKLKLKRAQHEVELSMAEAVALASPETTAIHRNLISKLSNVLTERQITAVAMHAAGATYDEIGAKIGGITRERARQVTFKGLRKMREAAEREKITCMSDLSDG